MDYNFFVLFLVYSYASFVNCPNPRIALQKCGSYADGSCWFCHARIRKISQDFGKLQWARDIVNIMSRIVYDNWERLVVATLRREQLWELFHAHSRTPSVSSSGSGFSFSSPLLELPFDFSSSSSWYQQNSVRETHIRGYKANDLEVAALAGIIKAEKSPEVRQLAPGDIFVNGKALTSRELAMLQSCRYPPKKLTPGNYWYDRVSGLWGKVICICFLQVMLLDLDVNSLI